MIVSSVKGCLKNIPSIDMRKILEVFMTNQNDQAKLRKGDLVLMNFDGIGENGPVFEFLEKIDGPDLTD